MSNVSKQMAGRKYDVGNGGASSLTVPYEILMDNIMGATGELLSFTGVPAIGSRHPVLTNLVVDHYECKERTDGGKKVLDVDVVYSPVVTETSGTGEEAQTFVVTEWGWDNGTDEKELVSDVLGKNVLNSAGDPYDNVPTVSVPAPVFTKVMKFKERQSGAMDCNCKVVAASKTIGGMSCPSNTLLCCVSEKRLYNDGDWKYQYTIQLKFKSNKVKVNGNSAVSEIGWMIAIADSGMRVIDDEGKKKIVRMLDEETGCMCQVTSPVLLDGSGKKAAEGADGNPTPYNKLYQAYEYTSIPDWFISEE